MTYGPVPATLSTECWPKNTLLQSGSQITLCHTHVSETPAFPLARYLWYFSSPVLLGPPPASLPSWPVLPGTMARAPLPSHLWGHHSREVSECLSALLLLSVHFKAVPTGPSLLESTCQVQRSGLLCDEAILAQKTFWGGRIQQSYRNTGLAIKSVQVFIPSYRKPERSIWSTRYKHTCVFTFFFNLIIFHFGGLPWWLSSKRIHPSVQETQETWVWSLGQEDLLEKGMATHPSILARRIPWAEKPDGLQSMGSQESWIQPRNNNNFLFNNQEILIDILNPHPFSVSPSLFDPGFCSRMEWGVCGTHDVTFFFFFFCFLSYFFY